jgi:tRNA(His) 5'-end guanylyltransferase
MKDNFGDRMKGYESAETGRRFMPGLPVYARIDGRSFSKFTKGMNRPFDIDMTRAMIETTKFLVDKTHALMGYCQSDEISLIWYSESTEKQIFFDGRIQKMTSVLAGMASSKFTLEAIKTWPSKVENSPPVFDCRVFQLPSLVEGANAFLWREQDASKNSISMAAHDNFSPKQLHKVNGKEMQEMLWAQKGINWNDYPAFFKRGTFIRRCSVEKVLSQDELDRIPEQHRPEGGRAIRTELVELDMPRFSSVTNRVDVIFNGADPITEEK